ncbi:STAS/SEC14 domain-containing protein [Aliiglaciecola litoralis]|uniref:STAS/SEC14 domain-containing protein n=1 Tax=Aliiglaciecola litoralis TaxID=582857 RepID=A0ABP3X3F4_9ALTE
MLMLELDEADGIAILEPNGELSESDFISVAKIIDQHIEHVGQLHGIIIHVKYFPGWDSFSALTAHLKFVRDHHKKVSRVAFVTDSTLGNLAGNIASHFVHAEIKRFTYNELATAKAWIVER